jgi:integrase
MRPRKRGNNDLPKNLHVSVKNGKSYFQYQHPETKKYTGFGTDKKEAIKAAIQLNQLLISTSNLVDKVIKPAQALSEYITYYLEQIIPNKRVKGFPLSEKTITENKRVFKHINKELGHIDFQSITQKDIADYLNQQSSAETHNKHRAQLVLLFKQAISDGLIEDNLPERILKKDKEAVKRTRLSLEQYKRIYNHASLEIQRAMELSLNALQRREDIRSWRFDSEKDGFYHIIQSKTRKHGIAAYLRIPHDLPVAYSLSGAKTLKDIIDKCRDNKACPFVIHKLAGKRRRSKEKEHPMQLSGKQISDGFAEAREKAGITMDNPPTFHELLSLGELLRKEQGWSIKQIQTLRGHTSEKTTLAYLDGQEWSTVQVPKQA